MKESQSHERPAGRTGYSKAPSVEKLLRRGLERDERVSNFLETVDLKTLREIFEEMHKKSGANPKDINFVGAERFFVGDIEYGAAHYNPEDNTIVVARSKGKGLALERVPLHLEPLKGTGYFAVPGIDTKALKRINALEIVIHEETHAIALQRREQIGHFLTSFINSTTREISGYRVYEEETKNLLLETWRFFGEILDEGITQMITQDTLVEYVRRVGPDRFGITRDDVQKYISCSNSELFQYGFHRKSEVRFVRIFMEYLAEAAETSVEQIWEGIKRGYIRGGDLFDQSIKDAFTDAGLEKILSVVKSSDHELSQMLVNSNNKPGDNSRENAIGAANRKLFQDLRPDSQEYLSKLWNDNSGTKVRAGVSVKTRNRGWQPYDDVFDSEGVRRAEAEPIPGEVEYLEPLSPRLEETYKLAEHCFETRDFNALNEHLAARYAKNDEQSYDCHSFMLTIARDDLDLPVPTAPAVEKPKLEDFESEYEWEQAFKEKVSKMFESAEGKEFVQDMKEYTEDMYDSGEHIAIPHTEIRGLASVQGAKDHANRIVKEIIESISNAPASRVLLISNGRGESFQEIHSTVILGIEKGGEDILVIEKWQMGNPVEVQKLSRLIELQSLNYHDDLEINICR